MTTFSLCYLNQSAPMMPNDSHDSFVAIYNAGRYLLSVVYNNHVDILRILSHTNKVYIRTLILYTVLLLYTAMFLVIVSCSTIKQYR